MTPPNTDSTTDSVSICAMMSERRAPSALRSPISRVRSVTTISMMFMMTMPPTTSDSADDADEHGEDAVGRRVVDVEDRVGREHAEVVGLLRLQPPRDPQRDRRVVHRLRDLREVARLDASATAGAARRRSSGTARAG